MIQFNTLDFSRFHDVPAPVRYYDQRKLTVSTNGVLSLNRPFLQELGAVRSFQMQLSEDGRYILLRAEDAGRICFSEKGILTHPYVRDAVASFGFSLPVRYVFDWCEDQSAWVGCCEELPPLPPINELMPVKRRGRRNAA